MFCTFLPSHAVRAPVIVILMRRFMFFPVAQKFKCCLHNQMRNRTGFDVRTLCSQSQPTSSNCVLDHPWSPHRKVLAASFPSRYRSVAAGSEVIFCPWTNTPACSVGRSHCVRRRWNRLFSIKRKIESFARVSQ